MSGWDGKKLALLAVGAAVAAVIGVWAAMRGGAPDGDGEVRFVRMVTGPSGGSWYPLGAKLAQIIEREIPGISAASGPGAGVSNVLDINSGNAELGFGASNSTYQGYRGLGKFRSPQTDLRHIATLYPLVFQIAVPRTSDIRSIADLRDKSISPGKAGWTGMVLSEAVLGAYGLDLETIKANGGTVHHVDFSDSVALMKDRHIDVLLAITNVPQATFVDLNFQPGIRFLPIGEAERASILRADPSYLPMTIPKSAYEGMTEDVPTLGAMTILMTHRHQPEELIYRICKALWAHRDELIEVKAVWREVLLENALQAAPIPIHPGAQRCYDELGVVAKS